jgi:hypothetical protein
MRTMNSATKLQQQGYTGVKVTSMLKAVLCVEMREHLRLVQLDALNKINNKYFKTGYISKSEMTLLWNVYWNFVLNDYRFEDKSKKLTKVSNVIHCEYKHIGLRMLNDTNA